MTPLLSSISQTAKSIGSRATFGAAYAVTADGWIVLTVTLSGLNGATATLTPDVEITRGGNSFAVENVRYSVMKRDATKQYVQLQVGPFRVVNSDSVQLHLVSSNASDSSVSGTVYVDDALVASAADVVNWRGTQPNALQTGRVDAYAGVVADKTDYQLLAAQRVKLDAAQPDYAPAKAGDAMALTSGERDSVAAVIESHLLNEGDSQMLINAIVGAIGNTNVDEAVLVAAIRADLERAGGSLKLIQTVTDSLTIAAGKVAATIATGDLADIDAARAAKIDNLDVAVSSRNATAPDNAGISSAATAANAAAAIVGHVTYGNAAIQALAGGISTRVLLALPNAAPNVAGGLLIVGGTGLSAGDRQVIIEDKVIK